MKVATATIHAGICGFVTRVRVVGDDSFVVRLAIERDCDRVRAFAAGLASAGPLNALDEITRGHEGVLLSTAAQHCRGCCAACVAPDGAFKALQVAAGLALPAAVQIELESEG